MSTRRKRNLIGAAAIREKSRELELPMERLLTGYVMEELAVRLAESAYGDRLLLKNPDTLGLSGCARGAHRLYYACVCEEGETFSKSGFAAFLKKTVKWETVTNIEWAWRSHMEENRLIVELSAELEELKLPVELVIEPVRRDAMSHPQGSHTLRRLMETTKTVLLPTYPAWEQFMDDLGEVLTRLELIGDMAVFERLYETLGMLGFEGRPFQRELRSYCETHGIALDALRYGQMERYADYPYLEKKWNAYVKRQRRVLPAWNEVYGRLWQALSPVWDAIMQDMLYLGSWIPDLGRYLD